MFVWVSGFNGMGLVSALVFLALVIRLVRRRLMPGGACMAGSIMGFCASAAFAVSSGGNWSFQHESLTVIIWVYWVGLAPLILPLEAGLLGWLGTASFWRWLFLALGIILTLLPWVAAPILHLAYG